jgi:hypothetical protein
MARGGRPGVPSDRWFLPLPEKRSLHRVRGERQTFALKSNIDQGIDAQNMCNVVKT